MAFMAPHRRSEYADEPQHMAFRALYPDIPLHVCRAPTYDDLLPALARVTLAEAHEADARENNPGREPKQMPLIMQHTFMVVRHAYGSGFLQAPCR